MRKEQTLQIVMSPHGRVDCVRVSRGGAGYFLVSWTHLKGTVI